MIDTPVGVLLINLGTPDDPSVPSVRRYLREFLMDSLVIDIPALFRFLLVYFLILPRRAISSAALYQKIWTDRGSPLRFHTQDLAKKVQEQLGSRYRVVPAMRYGSPSILAGMRVLKQEGVSRILIVPLYPQYSLASTESSVREVRRVIASEKMMVQTKIMPEFYSDPRFIEAFARIAELKLSKVNYSHLFFSFHGLPEHQVKRTDLTGTHCLVSNTCCDSIVAANQKCYRAQCYETARKLAYRLNLKTGSYTVCFQSRLGRRPWIQPYTDKMYTDAAQKGIKRLAVMSPSFVADCLETLEEIEIRGREQFVREGGEDLYLVPSLNSSDAWVKALSEMVQEELPV